MMIKYIFTLTFLLSLFSQSNLTQYVDPFIGTGGHGHTYPGASMPFGMVQLSPDTRTEGWDACSGYHYSDQTIMGFSHTHLSGTGAPDYGDILFMPFVGKNHLFPGDSTDTSTGYRSRFSHQKEQASPGFYSVFLEDYQIQVDLTVTQRAGFHQYQYDMKDVPKIIIDLDHGIEDRVLNSSIKFENKQAISGSRISNGWAKEQHVYFYAEFNTEISKFDVFEHNKINNKSDGKGENIKAILQFKKTASPVQVRIGISAVSIENAKKNLHAEINHWDFEKTKQDASKAWEMELSKIQVQGDEDRKIKFYTALYHSFLAPNLFMDVDRQYRGIDGNIHTANNHDNYTVFSLWDTFRATHPLFNLVMPERNNEFIKTLIAKHDEGGILPIWELAGNYTATMIGYHSIPLIADAIIKGTANFDQENAFEAMKHAAMQDHLGLAEYKRQGYIPADVEHESVSKALEYAYDDWCIAQVAKKLGKTEDYTYFIERAQYYKNHFDPKTGFMRAKKNGKWNTPFTPYEVSGDYTEANAWQYSYFVPHAMTDFIKQFGGDVQFEQKLDDLFQAETSLEGRDQPDITGLIGQYAHGNEPSHNFAYLYHFVGKPWKAQEKLNEIMDRYYTTAPDGLSGNEDCGQMSSWYNFSAIGLYPFNPGDDKYFIGVPRFDNITVQLPNGKSLKITASNLSNGTYVKSVRLNGQPLMQSYLRHGDLINGGTLEFEMSNKPNTSWASEMKYRPVNSTVNDLPVTPFVVSGEKAFFNSQTVSFASIEDKSELYYRLNSTQKFKRYSKPITVSETTDIEVYSQIGSKKSKPLFVAFIKIPEQRKISYRHKYSHLYTAGGELGLLDLQEGGDNFKNGWQGFQGDDLDVIIDLYGQKNISQLTIGFLQNINSWIFPPKSVDFYVSDDGQHFKKVSGDKIQIPTTYLDNKILRFQYDFTTLQGRYVKVIAKNISDCPDWHRGKGGKAWIFVDEIGLKVE